MDVLNLVESVGEGIFSLQAIAAKGIFFEISFRAIDACHLILKVSQITTIAPFALRWKITFRGC